MKYLNIKAFFVAAFVMMAGSLYAVEDVDIEAQMQSFFPLIPDSTYTYEGIFEGRTSTDTCVVKSMPIAGRDAFYFVNSKDVRDPDAILRPNSIGLGLYFKADDGIASLGCFFKYETNRMKKDALGKLVTIIKNSAEPGTVIEAPVDGTMKMTFKSEGREDMTVPAGAFKDCLKLTITESYKKAPPEKDVVYTATAWLAKGVGVVKWIRGTGRVEVLTKYTLGEPTK